MTKFLNATEHRSFERELRHADWLRSDQRLEAVWAVSMKAFVINGVDCTQHEVRGRGFNALTRLAPRTGYTWFAASAGSIFLRTPTGRYRTVVETVLDVQRTGSDLVVRWLYPQASEYTCSTGSIPSGTAWLPRYHRFELKISTPNEAITRRIEWAILDRRAASLAQTTREGREPLERLISFASDWPSNG